MADEPCLIEFSQRTVSFVRSVDAGSDDGIETTNGFKNTVPAGPHSYTGETTPPLGSSAVIPTRRGRAEDEQARARHWMTLSDPFTTPQPLSVRSSRHTSCACAGASSARR